jgi:hypothetical protein
MLHRWLGHGYIAALFPFVVKRAVDDSIQLIASPAWINSSDQQNNFGNVPLTAIQGKAPQSIYNGKMILQNQTSDARN